MSSTVEEVIAFRQKRFDNSIELLKRKGADYNRDQQEAGDTLFNLRVAELLGVVGTTEQGILVRLSDKLMRLISLTKSAGIEAQVKDESVLDTIEDVHNYVDYLGLLYMKRRKIQSTAAADEKLLTETVTCMGCLDLKGTHSYGENCLRNREER